MENRFPSLDEGCVEGTLGILDTLLDDSELNIFQHLAHNVTGVFETGGHSVGCSSLGEEFDVVDCIVFRQIEPGVIGLTNVNE